MASGIIAKVIPCKKVTYVEQGFIMLKKLAAKIEFIFELPKVLYDNRQKPKKLTKIKIIL